MKGILVVESVRHVQIRKSIVLITADSRSRSQHRHCLQTLYKTEPASAPHDIVPTSNPQFSFQKSHDISSATRSLPVLHCDCTTNLCTHFLFHKSLSLTHSSQVSISSPTWEKISFLDVTAGGRTTHFGVFGYTGSKVAIGYTFAAAGFKYVSFRCTAPSPQYNLPTSIAIPI